MLTSVQREKLPRAAQDLIADLERQIREKDKLLAELHEDNINSPITWNNHVHDIQRPLPEGATIRFMLDEGNWIDAMLRQDIIVGGKPGPERQPYSTYVEVRAGGRFHHRLITLPQAANSMHLGTSY